MSNSEHMRMAIGHNPVIHSDFPDPDIIRVGETYYMASTTMFLMPGCDVLKSYDLVHWELLAHAYDELDDTPAQRLEEKGRNAYGCGMWAPSLRYHDGIFSIVFTANDTKKTYVLEARDPAGPWKKHAIEGFYHDNSVLYDDDGRVYIVYGNMQLHLTELEPDLSRPKSGGLNRIIAEDDPEADLGFEGSHIYRYEGRYYVWTCHYRKGHRKTEVCLMAEALDAPFEAREILDDDLGYHDLGDAQGGMVDTPDGRWYAFMMHDRGALGRVPTIMPMRFGEDGFPVLGDDGVVPIDISVPTNHADYHYEPLNGSDDFQYRSGSDSEVSLRMIKPFWQFNHQPHHEAWSLTERPGSLVLHGHRVVPNLNYAWNTLTQRTVGPRCMAEVTVDASALQPGDFAGLAAIQGYYRFIAISNNGDGCTVSVQGKPHISDSIWGDGDYDSPAVEYASAQLSGSRVRLRAIYDFTDKKDLVAFEYLDPDAQQSCWSRLGDVHELHYTLDYFIGCRIGLFLLPTMKCGGAAAFHDFRFFNAEETPELEQV
ncbi:glycoside hydrolase 43 family protein [Bifidobacterium olomucense]|uniref:Arabinofuranohydrolase n=1 Tax=Bifidobacterium olomucense TaxID=2675324 RepID=A0A7Y0EVR7_9BIFI|nr:glycoside hydrolase 43 family protein [Bifidobacterium sp. DSM 109959]NMM97319.1 arabinofuranohydrolase [Bifidobacterium sp. DSM 109959]